MVCLKRLWLQHHFHIFLWFDIMHKANIVYKLLPIHLSCAYGPATVQDLMNAHRKLQVESCVWIFDHQSSCFFCIIELDCALMHFVLWKCWFALLIVPSTALEGKRRSEAKVEIARRSRVGKDDDRGVGLQFESVFSGYLQMFFLDSGKRLGCELWGA